MEKVSIIIPVYNVERYLEQCVRSAMNQTLREIEILCVNDGSTDSSLEILQRLAAEDDRIRMMTKENSGYGHTMNVGIENSRGKYLIFLESDDFIAPEFCEEMYGLCERYALDMAKSDYYEFKTKRHGAKVCARYRKTSDYDHYHQVLNPAENTDVFYDAMYTWTCMYRRDFLEQHKIRHHETPGASFQDNGFWFQSLMHCKRLYLTDKAFYYYRQDNPASSIHNKEKVYAFSKEYAFIREKIAEYDGKSGKNADGETDASGFGDVAYRKKLLQICAFFNLHHNMNSLERVDKKYTAELIQLILEEFEIYRKLGAWNVNGLYEEFLRKLLICMAQEDALREKVWAYLDKKASLYHTLDAFDRYILYGAGMYARKALEQLESLKVWNKDLVCGVTSLDGQPDNLNGVKVEEMAKLLPKLKASLVILCAKKGTAHYEQMKENLTAWGVCNVIHADDLVLESFWREI